MPDGFTARKFQWLDRVMLDTRLSFGARCVAWKIQSHLNRHSQESWPSHETMATALGMDQRTVRRSIRAIKTLGYLAISLRGRHYVYRLKTPNGSRAEKTPDKNAPDTGQNGSRKADIDAPLTPLVNTFRILSGGQGKKKEGSLREARGDERIERLIIRMFEDRGHDGTAIMTRLHELDGGRPRLRVLQTYRRQGGRLTEQDLADARLEALGWP